MIKATLRLTCTDPNWSRVVGLFRSVLESTRVKTGCTHCGLYMDLHDSGRIVWVEEWRTRNDLARHFRSPQYGAILAAMDLSAEAPDIHFDTVVEREGMGLIESARCVENPAEKNSSGCASILPLRP